MPDKSAQFPSLAALGGRLRRDLTTGVNLNHSRAGDDGVVGRLLGILGQDSVGLPLDALGNLLDDEVGALGLDGDDGRHQTREEGGEDLLALGGGILLGCAFKDEWSASALQVRAVEMSVMVAQGDVK